MTANVRTAQVAAPRQRRLKRRHLWLVPGLAIAIFANGQASLHGLGLVPLLAFGIAPHLPALLPGSVRLFNLSHQPLAPLAVLAAATIGLLPPFWSVGALAWLSHIVVDWALGDGIRSTDGSRRGGPA